MTGMRRDRQIKREIDKREKPYLRGFSLIKNNTRPNKSGGSGLCI